ncbi:CPBP family intramembrane metalloprotease [bacterium CPR1]|nr:CPBP family intramembrane metalloprotease [bacterium CPR1]
MVLVLLTVLWLAMVSAVTVHRAGRSSGSPLNEQVGRALLMRLARIAIFASPLSEEQRQRWREQVAGLMPEGPEKSLVQGRSLAPEVLPEGWYRDLARGLGPTTQQAAADRDLWLLAAGSAWMAVGLGGGLTVLGWWLARGRLHFMQDNSPPPLQRTWFLFVSWQLMAMLGTPALLGLAGPAASIRAGIAAQFALYALGWAMIGHLTGPLRPTLRGLGQGLAAYWVASPGVWASARLIEWLTGQSLTSRNPALDMFRDPQPETLIWLGVLVVLAGPWFEELLFRGLVYRAMRPAAGRWGATMISAALFAVAHGDPSGFVPYMILGIVFAQAVELTGSVFPAFIAHGLFNGQTYLLLCLLSAG